MSGYTSFFLSTSLFPPVRQCCMHRPVAPIPPMRLPLCPTTAPSMPTRSPSSRARWEGWKNVQGGGAPLTPPPVGGGSPLKPPSREGGALNPGWSPLSPLSPPPSGQDLPPPLPIEPRPRPGSLTAAQHSPSTLSTPLTLVTPPPGGRSPSTFEPFPQAAPPPPRSVGQISGISKFFKKNVVPQTFRCFPDCPLRICFIV